MKQEASLPLVLNRPRLTLFPTFYGFLFMGVLAAMLIGSINYNNNLGFVLVFLLGSMGLVSILHTHRNLSGLGILSVSATPVFAGDVAIFSLLVRSGTSSRSAVTMALQKGGAVVETMPAGTDRRIDLKVATRTRGILLPGPLTIWSRFPLGLFRIRATLGLNVSCLVYPIPIAGSPFQTEGAGDLAANGKNRDRGVDDFAGLAPYRPGDPIRHIAWKSLSRGLGVFIKDFDAEGRSNMMFDYNALKEPDPELRLSFLCDLVVKAHAMKIKYGLALPGQTIGPGKGDRHRHRCLKALALFGKGG